MEILDKPLTKIKPKKEKLEPTIWAAMKRDVITKALMQCDGSSVKAARLLGITRQQVWNYRKELGL